MSVWLIWSRAAGVRSEATIARQGRWSHDCGDPWSEPVSLLRLIWPQPCLWALTAPVCRSIDSVAPATRWSIRLRPRHDLRELRVPVSASIRPSLVFPPGDPLGRPCDVRVIMRLVRRTSVIPTQPSEVRVNTVIDSDTETRARIQQHWDASECGDIESELAIYAADAILAVRSPASASAAGQGSSTARRAPGRTPLHRPPDHLWVSECVITYDGAPT